MFFLYFFFFNYLEDLAALLEYSNFITSFLCLHTYKDKRLLFFFFKHNSDNNCCCTNNQRRNEKKKQQTNKNETKETLRT